uniref:Uncharacterized protein n=1 Tax=viral metagenome TaxID=1070528 RepID=A0A6M3KXP9_9ZZZZ
MKGFIDSVDFKQRVRINAVRNFSIEMDKGKFKIIAWFGDSSSIHLGVFPSHGEARDFLEAEGLKNGF